MASFDTLGIFVPEVGDSTQVTTWGTPATVITNSDAETTVLPNVGTTIEDVGISYAAVDSTTTTSTFAGRSNLTSLIGNEGDNAGIFQGKSNNGLVELGDGDDSVFATNIRQSAVDLGDGDNTLVTGQVNGAVFTSGDGDDSFTVTGTAKNLTVDSGAGDDTLIFGGNVSTSTFLLGDGADSISFGGRVRQTTIDLGSDTDVDVISFTSKAAIADGVVVTGAGDGDLLVIGGEEYVYDSDVSGFVGDSETISFG